MLDERDYMRRDPDDRFSRMKNGYGALLALIGLNFVIFLFQNSLILQDFALFPEAVAHGEVWRFLTSAFLHGNFMHLLMNMFGLYVFGMLAAPLLGQARFLGLYLVSAVVGNILWYAFNVTNPFAFVIGASGAVMGIIIASAMLVPDIPMMILFIPVPVKLKTLAVVYILLEVFSQAVAPGTPVAYLAHIGGFFGGYLFMILAAKKQIAWDPLSVLYGKLVSVQQDNRAQKPQAMPRGWRVSNYDPGKGAPVPQAEIDRLLDKLSRVGINGLSEAEQETLRRAEKEMSSRK